jgi:D-alanyl-D-alanine carboxypeptidase
LSSLSLRGARLRRALVALLLAAFALTVSTPSLTALGGSPRSTVYGAVSAETAGFLAEALDRAQWSTRTPGLAFAVIGHDRRGWTGVSGHTPGGGAHLSLETPLNIGSVTKTFTAAIILDLVEQGRLRLKDQVTKFVPNAARIAPGVTIAQLLRHNSGVGELYRNVSGRLSASPHQPLTALDVLGAAGTPMFRPGKGWSYSNTNYYLLGLVAQRVTGKSFDMLVDELVTVPHGLSSTDLPPVDQPSAAGLPAGWASAFWTSGSMSSTARDLAWWSRVLYGSDWIIDKPMRAAMSNFDANGYGYGTQRFKFGGRPAVGHSGLLYTNTSLMLYFPKEALSVAIIATTPGIDLNVLLTERYAGKPSLLELARRFGR